MATVTLTIPDTVVARVTDAFIAQYPPPEGVDVSTADAKAEYVKTRILDYMKQVVVAHEATVAVETARKAAATKSDKEIKFT